jgi:cytochrome c peroxidase
LKPFTSQAARPVRRVRPAQLALLVAAAALMPNQAAAQTAASLYKDADLSVGEKLLREHRCAECHIRKVGGDGAAIYRPLGRINTPGALRGMVEQCNLELNLALFPDEVTSISAVLNRDHYRFK